ncbi:hypothetical protein BG011_005928 [Mortierella polycephala]|uniref:Uncharacterized protein n=1 Tax=Mortierella polycephala TaxID=41804 RepID=A0A9P6PU35_9FUNG|nr:hypothetical protein BG011_005928 [Mortierella polycephala]
MIMHQVWESESGCLSVNDQEDVDSDDMSEYEQEHRPVHVQGRPSVNGLDDSDDDDADDDDDDDGQDSDDDEHMMDEDFVSPSRRPFDYNFQVQQSQQHQSMDTDQTCFPQAERVYNPSLPIIANEIKATWHLSADLGQSPQDDSDNDQPDCEEQQQHFHGGDSNLEEGLPELKISLTDPVGSRFEELLYWIYTDNGPRWLASFTPHNYDSILANILKLNIITTDVLEICRAFEASTSPDLGLYGRAEAALALPLDPLTGSMAASAAAAAAAVAGSAIHV